MTIRGFFVFAGLLFFLPSAYAQRKPVENQVLFTVGSNPVSSSEFIYLYQKNHQGKPGEFTEEKIREYLDLFVNFKLKVAEAKARGIDTTLVFTKEFDSYKEELKKPYVASADELSKLVKEAYDRMTIEVHASHILVNVQADAQPKDTLAAFEKVMSLRQRALAGEPFETLAASFSEDPTARENGGDLGYFTGLQMVYPFETAAFSLEPGAISMPVRTRFGYHVIKLFDKRPASGEVEVSHILLRGKDEKVKNKIFEINDQLRAGRKWEDLCKEFSEDPATKDNGGRLQRFGVGALASLPEFEAMAFALREPGEVSDPFQSAIGWHLVRLEQKVPVPTFQEMEPSLKRRVSRDERLQLKQAENLSRRKSEYNVIESEEKLRELESKADTSLQKGRWNVATEKMQDRSELLSVAGKPITVAEFAAYVKEQQRPSALPPTAYYHQLYDKFVEKHIGAAEDVKLQRENPEYRNILNEYREGILLFSIMETEVWNRASEDSTGQRKFYEANSEKYKAGERLYARIFSTPDKAVVDATKVKIARGDTLKSPELKAFKSVSTFRGYERGDHKAIDQVAWTVGLHEAEADGMYYLVEVERLLPAGIKKFEEARANIISDYQDNLEKMWVAELRKKYPVKFQKKTVKAVIASLKK